MKRLIPLECSVQHYAWGHTTTIPELLGIEPDGRPYAELWAGDHPVLPSVATVDGAARPLDDLIGEHTEEILGPILATRRSSLPFLTKILAIAQPLSLQAHPDQEQARAGFAREDRAGLPRDAPNRCYRDASHKPELLIALEPVEALCGFRDPHDVADDLVQLGGASTRALGQSLGDTPDAGHLLDILGEILSADGHEAATICSELTEGIDRLDAHQRELMGRLIEAYPGDHNVLVALLLRHLRLAPGDALFLGPGVLHAYLDGSGVEVMAASDNVLRGGMTPKHVDVDELLAILRPEVGGGLLVTPRGISTGIAAYDVPVDDFFVTRCRPAGTDTRKRICANGPAVVLCSSGTVTVESDGDVVTLAPGHALLASAPSDLMITGDGVAWHVASEAISVVAEGAEIDDEAWSDR